MSRRHAARPMPRRATPSPRRSTKRSSSKPRPAPARRRSSSAASSRSSPSGRADVDEIVAVTFTEKAAGELKLRLARALDERARCRAPMATRARGSTTRCKRSRKRTSARFTASAPSCCASVRSRRASIRCSRCSPSRAARLFDEAFARWLQEQLARPARRRPPRAAPRRRFGGERRRRSTGCASAAWELAQWRDFTAPWTRPPFDRDAADRRSSWPSCTTFAALTARSRPRERSAASRHRAGPAAQRRDHAAAGIRRRRGADYDGWEARLVDLSRDRVARERNTAAAPGYATACRATACCGAVDALRGAARSVPDGRRRRSRRAAAAGAARRASTATRS